MDSICEKQGKKSKLEKDGNRPTITMESLPREISFSILSSLSITSLAKLKFVCRAWCNLAKDPLLINMHFLRMTENDPCFILHQDYPLQDQNYFVDFSAQNETDKIAKKFCVPMMPKFDLVGSCNGLLCLSGSSPAGNSLCVYNPFTRDYLRLPDSIQGSDKELVNRFGFGYHPTTKDYKVINIYFESANRYVPCSDESTKQESHAQVLTLGSSTWRSIGKLPYNFVGSRFPPVLLNGRLHWIIWSHKYRLGPLLVSFDLADEQFREVVRPGCRSFGHGIMHLVVLGGCLAAAFFVGVGNIEIWVMKDYNVKKSWIKEFYIRAHLPRIYLEQGWDPSFRNSKLHSEKRFFRVICLLKNGEILLEYMNRGLSTYDPKSRTFKDLIFPGMPSWFETVVHVGSLNWIDTPIDM